MLDLSMMTWLRGQLGEDLSAADGDHEDRLIRTLSVLVDMLEADALVGKPGGFAVSEMLLRMVAEMYDRREGWLEGWAPPPLYSLRI